MKHSECVSTQRLLALRPADWDEDERRRTTTHLASCAECGQLARLYAAQDQALQSLPTAGLDPGAGQRLWARLAPGKPAARPRMAWGLGAIALAIVALAAGLLLWPGSWPGRAGEATPAMSPTQLLAPSPTITPTTALTPTPVGDTPPAPVAAGRTPYAAPAGRWEGPQPTAFYEAAVRTAEPAGP